MILGLSVPTFTLIHVLISLVGIGSGALVVVGLLTSRRPATWTAIFLATTILTSATGFLFHSLKIGPPHVVGAISLVVLAVALWALYGAHLKGVWRPVYVVSAILALYLNVFVLVVQLFGKVAALKALAPTGTEPPFGIAQLLLLLGFIALGYFAVRRFHPAPDAA